MKIKNNERHKINSGKLARLERDQSKDKRKKEIRNARKNKQLIHDFETRNSMFSDVDEY